MLPENIENSTFKIVFVDLAGVETSAYTDQDGFWAIPFPLIKKDNYKDYYIELHSIVDEVVTNYFIDGYTLEITPQNRIEYIFNTELGKYFPDIDPISITSSTENIGIVNLQELNNNFSIVRGEIIAETDFDFDFQATNIDTGFITLFENSNMGYNRFGFKIEKNSRYIFSFNILENGDVKDTYFVNYRDDNLSKIDIFAISELVLNSSNIPQFSKYIKPTEDINISLNFIEYFNSISILKGSVKVDTEKNLTLTILDAEDGKFIDEINLDNFSSNLYSYSTTLGRDFKNRKIAIYLTDLSNPTTHYIYDSETISLKIFQDSDFIEYENGLLPDPSIFEPLKILVSLTTINLDLTKLQSYTIDGNVTIPDSLKLGQICKNDLNITKYGNDCNISMESLGFNFLSLEFLDIDKNSSTIIDLDSERYIFETDSPKNIQLTLSLSIYNEITEKSVVQNYILQNLGDSKSLTSFKNNAIYPNIKLDDNNKTVSINLDLKSLLDRQFRFSGSFEKDSSIEYLQLSILDAQNGDILGKSTILENSSYLIELDKFADSDNLNNDILIELSLIRNGMQEIFFFSENSIVSNKKISAVQINSNWIIDKNSSGFISLQDYKYNYEYDIDLTTLLADFDNNLYTLSGNIRFGEYFNQNSLISIELIDKNSGELVNPISYETDENETDFSFDIKVGDSGDYIILIFTSRLQENEIYENVTYIYNPITEKMFDLKYVEYLKADSSLLMIPNPEISGYISFDNSHKLEHISLIPDELLTNRLSITGVVSNVTSQTYISIYSSQGKWLGEDKLDSGGNYSISLPFSEIGDNIYLKISSELESYFLGLNNLLIESGSVIEDADSLNFGTNITPITLGSENSKNLNIAELVEYLEKQRYMVYGDVTGLDENMTLQIIDINNKKYLEPVIVTANENNWSIHIPNGGEFILYISTDSKELFFDFNNSIFISANSVDFINVDGFWIPDSQDSGSVQLNTAERQKKFDLDFSDLENSFLTISGTIILPSEFLLGEQCLIDSKLLFGIECTPLANQDYKFISWIGGHITLIDRSTADEVGFLAIETAGISVDNGIEYKFSLDIDNSDSINREILFKLDIYQNNEDKAQSYTLYYDFQNGKTVNGKMVSELNTTKTGWLSLSNSETDLLLDFSLFQTEQKQIKGEIRTPSEFSLSENENSMNLYLYNSENGEYLDMIELYSDKNFSFYVGEDSGEYLLSLELIHQDSSNQILSYKKRFYLDFGDSHNRESISILGSDEIRLIEKGANIVPNTEYLELNETISLSIDMENSSGSDISGEISSDIDVTTFIIILKDYEQDIEYSEIIDNGIFRFKDIKDGNYRVTILTESEDGKFSTTFIKDNGFVKNKDITWKRAEKDDLSTYYYPANIKIFEIDSDLENFVIDLGDFLDIETDYDLNITLNSKEVESGELFVPNSSIIYYLNCEVDSSCSINENKTSIVFKNIVKKENYYLNFMIDAKNYFYNSETGYLESGVEWIAYDSSDTKVCPTSENSWNCDWQNSIDWSWKPNIVEYNLEDMRNNIDLEISIPAESLIVGTINLGNSFANNEFTTLIYQLNNSIYQKSNLQTDSNGELNISIKVKPMTDYRIEILNQEVHYVLNLADNESYETIFNSDSWRKDIFGSKETALIDLTENLDFGNIEVDILKNVQIKFENLDENETIFVRLLKNSQSFESDNSLNMNQIDMRIASGNYKMVIYASSHNSGYAVNESNENNFTEFSWDYNSALDVTVDESSDTNLIILSLPSNSELKYISGTVNLGDGDIESGWIEIYNGDDRRGSVVEKDGNFKVNGLKPSEDYNYTLEYRSWETDNLVISQDIGTWGMGNFENIYVSKGAYSYQIFGNLIYSGADDVEVKAMLIQYDLDANSWKVTQKTDLNETGGYSFQNLQPLIGQTRYYICAGVKVSDSTGTHYHKFNATDGESNISIIEMNSSIDISFNKISVGN